MDTALTGLWEQTMQIIEPEISTVAFETFIKTLKLADVSGGYFILQTFDDYTKDLLLQRYLLLIQNSLKQASDNKYSARIVASVAEIPAKKSESKKGLLDTRGTLNPRYVFDTFVIGSSNRMAHAAALAVAESPAKAYNPLFLYGGVGLGKTHLMHSIAHRIIAEKPETHIVYASSEKFTNEMIEAIKSNNNEEFRKRYRSVDVLLIDDIQFLSDKESTQEEFFHTFNALHESNKQIIISSDRPPKEIQTLEERLRSRFEWGLIADINPPDYETRIAILKKKADIEGITVPNEVLIFIAKNIVANIRELEGALNRVAAYGKLVNGQITVDIAEQELKALFDENRSREITPDIIQDIVAQHYNIKSEDMRSKRRTANITYPRQVAMYLCRKLLETSLPKLGVCFGGRDHTTILHGSEKIASEAEKNSTLQKTLFELEKKITGS